MVRESRSELSVLLVEDNRADARWVAELLKEAAPPTIAVTHSARLDNGLSQLKTRDFSALLLDLSLPDSEGLGTFARARAAAPDVPIVVLTGRADEETAALAVRDGAQDYLLKSRVDGPLLQQSIRYAIERHASQAALRASEMRYRHLIEGSIQGILIHVDGVVQLANQAAADLIGFPQPQSLIGMNVWPLVAPEDRERLSEWARARREGLSVANQCEFRLVKLGGQTIWVDCVATTVTWSGSPATLATLVDITERKRTEEQLRASEGRFRQLADNIKEGLIVADLPDFTPSFLSHMWGEIWGREIETAYQNPEVWREAIHPDDRPAVLEGQLAIARGESALSVFRVTRPDGTMRWVRARTFPVFDNDRRVHRMVGLVEDITEIRRTEDQLRQAQKMEAVGRLAAGIAHDFNNLLTAILGYSDLVLSELPRDEPLARDVQQIRTAGESAANLTRQLLAFSRRQLVQPKSIDLNHVLRRIESLLRRVIGEDVVLTFTLVDPFATVVADEGQIEQTIMNLAVNARDAMPEGGRLTIETGFVDLDDAYVTQHAGATTGLHVMLAVSDTGIGMDQVTQKHIFEPFFTTKEAGKGTGLGLATVYGIVKQNHGSIWVYSEPGAGSTFKIYLPTTRSEPAAHAEEHVASDSWDGTETILVLEDQPEPRAVIRDTLQRHGYAVLEAASGKEAAAIALQHEGHINLLLTDVVMAGLNGRQVAELLHRTHPALRVIYMSGYTDDAIVRHGVLEPGLAFLQKPFSSNTLLRRVRQVLDAAEAPRV